uniref:Uncharacterized protein n=1 Tax=Rhizophora mucronata TaxID=61149 RepID=A0A2P2NAT2_RHIMU
MLNIYFTSHTSKYGTKTSLKTNFIARNAWTNCIGILEATILFHGGHGTYKQEI